MNRESLAIEAPLYASNERSESENCVRCLKKFFILRVMGTKSLSAVGVLAGGLALSATANGVNRDGIGARSMSMGGADAAFVEDALGSMGANPAGLAYLERIEVGLGLIGGAAFGDYEKGDIRGDLDGSFRGLPEAAFAWHACRVGDVPLPPNCAVDISAFAHAGFDQAPALASAGFLLSQWGAPVDDALVAGWIAGLRRLAGRKAFTLDRQSFAYRPYEVLGIAVGAALGSVGVAYLATVGLPIGDKMASVAGSGVALSTTMYARFVPGTFAALALATLAIVLLAAVYPAWYAARLEPVEALRAA